MASFFIALSGRWLATLPKFDRRIGEQHLLPIGTDGGGLAPECRVLVKFRDAKGRIVVDEAGVLAEMKGALFLKSEPLCRLVVSRRADEPSLILFLEGTGQEARCIVQELDGEFFARLEHEDPTLRLRQRDLPPTESTLVDAGNLVDTVHGRLSTADPELFAVHATSFLDAPHILVPLFEHVLGLTSEQQIDFPVRLKKLADQLRALLLDNPEGSVTIKRIARDHQAAWAEVLGDRISFLDGGVARIVGLPGTEPLAMRVGLYTVRPGVDVVSEREQWALRPYVVGDMLDPAPGAPPRDVDPPDHRKRLQEAARYVLEPLAALSFLSDHDDIRVLFLHGPLVNQFLQYDEGELNFIPCIKPEFLGRFGITQAEVERELEDVPSLSGQRLWNQFMAVYGYVQKRLFNHARPVVGVVERTRGRWVALGILDALVKDKVVKESYSAKVRDILERYDISDDFLFGCILAEGEFTTPIVIQKNYERRARERWQLVVRQYPQPFASLLKTSETAFPFRVELNRSAAKTANPFAFRLLYHTSRLLPRYAFPVGLDIVDRYAKVPDWLARGVSARLSAEVLKRALRTGDPRVVSQVRQLLARTPRDFFFRPDV